MQNIGRLGLLFFMILMFLFQLPSIGQNKKYFVVIGSVIPDLKTSENGTIDIVKGNTVTKMDIQRNGKFKLELEYFNEYKLVFSLPGHFSKTILVSTEIPQDVWNRDNDFPPFTINVQLFKEIEGIDKSFTLKPAGRVFYGKKSDNFETETIFSDIKIGEQIETAKTQSALVKKEVQTITKEEAQELAAKQRNYDQLIKEADVHFQRGEYQLALAKYVDAQKLFPEKAYVNDRIAELQDLVRALEITQKQKEELERKYKEAIAKADGFFDQKTYKQARPVYVEALQYKPGDEYANRRIKAIDEMVELLAKQKQYDDVIALADIAYNAKNFDQAISQYNQAKLLLPEKDYPQKQIDLINQEKQRLALLEQQQKDLNRKYLESIQLADKSLGSDDLIKAKTYYQEALAIKPSEAYPPAQIAKIDKMLAEKAKLQATENEFLALVGKGDEAFGQKDYTLAKNNYTNALLLKSGSTEVKNKIKNIDSILQKMADDKRKEEERLQALAAAKEKAYNDAIAKGNKLMIAKTYPEAKNAFQEAKNLKPTEKLPDEMIAKIDALIAENERILAEARQKEELFASTVKEAETLFKNKEYPGARSSFVKASEIKPNEPTVTRRIQEIDKILNDLAMAEAKDKAAEAAYQEAIKLADQAFKIDQLDEAEKQYQQALANKANDPYAKQQLVEVTKRRAAILAEKAEQKRIEEQLQAQEKAYNQAIIKGNKLFDNKTYPEARAAFQEAKNLKPTEKLPDEMIAKIDALIAENERILAEARQKEELFASTVKEAETLFKNKEYPGARSSYVKASEIKPNEPTVTRRIQEIDKILNDLAMAQAKDKAAEAAYQEAIKLADQAFKIDQLDEAEKQYQLALANKANDPYAKQQLNEITKRRAAILAEKAEQKRIDEQYAANIKTAQEAFRQNKLKEARDAYQKAQDLKPAEPIPPARIAEINTLIAQAEEAAKIAAMNNEQRLAKEKADKDQYDKAIAEADKAFAEKRYIESRALYTDALNVFPNEKYPKSQISKLDGLIARDAELQILARNKAKQDSILNAKEEAFNQTMASAKQLEQSKQYQNAIDKYKEAITIKPTERNNVQKLIASLEDLIRTMDRQDKLYTQSIAKADQLYAGKKLTDALDEYSNAGNIKTTEEYPKKQIVEIQKIIADQKLAYDNAIKTADQAFNESDWQNAKASYTEALLVKPNEAYPQKRLKETNQKINEEKLAGLANEKELAAYNDAMAKGEKAILDNQLTNAKMQFRLAQTIKPNEILPPQRIREIDAMIDQQAKDLLAQQQKDNDEKYRQAISVADNAFREKTYDIARMRYQEAQIIKPGEAYPRTQIDLIDNLLNVKQPAEPIAQTVPEPVMPAPATKVSTPVIYTKADYEEAIDQADKSFNIKDYSVSRFYYYKANEIKPEESYPIQRIEEIRKLVNAGLSNDENAAYELAIAKADEAFGKQNYMIAKFYYYKALEVKEWEKYPKDRIQEILALTNSLLSEKLEKEYRDLISKADQAYVEKDVAYARFYYNKAIAIKNNEDYPRIKLKDIQKLIDQDMQDEVKMEYNKLIEEGDQAMKDENYSIARFYYNKALNLKPKENYPKDQLKSLRELVKTQNKQ